MVNGVMQTYWDYRLVALSVLIAVIGSYLALDFLFRVTSRRGNVRMTYLLGGSITMGLAIWSMHFVGMLALKMNMPVSYDPAMTFLSIVAAVIGSGIAFVILNRAEVRLFHVVIGGIAMGLAIITMHYIGMASMIMPATIDYDPMLFALSVLIAFGASSGALWLAFLMEKTHFKYWVLQQLSGALVMGIAIAGMHYTGMAAASYTMVSGPSGAINMHMDMNRDAQVGTHRLNTLLLYALGVFAVMLLLLSLQTERERERMVYDLKKMSNRYKSLSNNEAVGIIVASISNGRILEANDAFLKMVGYSQEDFEAGRVCWDVMTPVEYRERDRQQIEAVRKTGTANNYEKQYIRKDGHRVDVWIVGIGSLEEASDLVVANVLDITQRKRQETQLKESEARFRQLSDTNLLGIAFWNIYGKVFEANDAFLNMLGYTRDDLKAGLLNWQVITRPQDQREHGHRVQRAIAGEEILPYEAEFIHKDGHKIEALIAYAMLEESRDQGFVFALDITERKLADQALRRSEQRFRSMADAMPQKVWTTLPNGKLEYVNARWLEYSGFSVEDLKEQGWHLVVHPDEQEEFFKARTHSLVEGAEFQHECRMRRHDGVYRWHLSRVVPQRDEAGNVVMWLGASTDIEDIKQTQAALKESERRFRIMADSMPQKVWTTLPDGEMNYMNQNWLNYTGKSWEELKDFGWFNVIHPDDRNSVKQIWDEALAQGVEASITFRMCRNDGVYRWHLSRGMPSRDETGNILIWVGTSTDIDDLHRYQEALKESEERFRLLAEQAPAIIWVTDPEGVCIYNNKYWRDFMGATSPDEALDWLSAVHPEDRDAFLAHHLDFVKRQAPSNYVYRMRRYDGEYRWIENNAVPRYTESGEFAGHVGISMDITTQKNVNEALEKKVKERTEALQRTNRLLQSVFDTAPVMIYVKEAEQLRFEMANKPLQALLGRSREDIVGKQDSDLFPAEQAALFEETDREGLNTGQLVDILDAPIITHTGETRFLHMKKVPILNEQGEPAYLLGVSEDVTEMREAQAKIYALNQQLQDQVNILNAVNKELEAFSYSVSHDLRAPLRTIDGYSQAILEDYEDKLDENGKRYLSRVREGSQEMAKLIDDMLNLSRLTRGEISKQNMDLSVMAKGIARTLQAQEPERRVDFLIQDNVRAEADPRLMQAVLQNLLGNAWKFTSHHDSAVIEFGSRYENDQTVYYVKDNGAGFDMAYANKLFGAFQRLHGVNEFPGSGIGLATVQRIIRRHGGDIWATGEVEKGATFSFTL